MLLIWCALVTSVAAQSTACLLTLVGAQTNKDFNWILASPADQKSNISDICQKQSRQDGFINVLAQIEADCLPVTNGTSPVSLAFSVLKGVLCLKKEGNYCSPGLLALFSQDYFTKLQTAAGQGTAPEAPDLTQLTTDQKTAICADDTCNSAVEQLAESYFPAALANSPDNGKSITQGAIDYCTALTTRMRCGCFKEQGNTCYTTATVNTYINFTSPPIFITTTSCKSDGSLKNCPRAFSQCQKIPPPDCHVPQNCSSGYTITISFKIANLNKTCFAQFLSAGYIHLDLAAILLGTKTDDFTLSCPTNNTDAGVACTATIRCVDPSMFSENNIVAKVLSYSKNGAVPSTNLDLLVPQCRLSATYKTYGETTTFSISVVGSGAAALSVSSLLLGLLLALF